MKSIGNKIPKVDLTARTCKTEQMPDEVYENFLGGAGMNAYMLWRECPRGTTAFDPLFVLNGRRVQPMSKIPSKSKRATIPGAFIPMPAAKRI